MIPYFQQGGVTLYHSSCVEVLGALRDRSVGLFLFDPPYTERVHTGMRSNKGRRGSGVAGAKRRGGAGAGASAATGKARQSVNPITFPPMTEPEAAEAWGEVARVAARWAIATVAFEHAARLYDEPPPPMRGIRVGNWTKIGPTPQMTGDRPAQGWEAIIMLHAPGPMHWNGGGRAAVYHHQAEMRGAYPTQKPEPLFSKLISDFADPGDLICDPFSGGGTTLVCAWRAGHQAIGCDVSERACEIAAKRLEAEMRQGRLTAPARAVEMSLFESAVMR